MIQNNFLSQPQNKAKSILKYSNGHLMSGSCYDFKTKIKCVNQVIYVHPTFTNKTLPIKCVALRFFSANSKLLQASQASKTQKPWTFSSFRSRRSTETLHPRQSLASKKKKKPCPSDVKNQLPLTFRCPPRCKIRPNF